MSLNGDAPEAPQPRPMPTMTRVGHGTVDDRCWVVLEVSTFQGVAVFFLDPEVVPVMAQDMIEAADRARAQA